MESNKDAVKSFRKLWAYRLLGSFWHPPTAAVGKWTPSRRPDGIPDRYYEKIHGCRPDAKIDVAHNSVMLCHVSAAVNQFSIRRPYGVHTLSYGIHTESVASIRRPYNAFWLVLYLGSQKTQRDNQQVFSHNSLTCKGS
jgi:hypothetical protein